MSNKKKIATEEITETEEKIEKTEDNAEEITKAAITKESITGANTSPPLAERQANTINQFVLPLAPSFSKDISLTPNVLPVEMRIGAAYSEMLALSYVEPTKPISRVATLTTRIAHFYAIDPHTDSNKATYPTDSLLKFDGEQVVELLCAAYDRDKRPKVGTLKIDYNGRDYGFTIDPRSEEFFTPHTNYSHITVNAISIAYQGSFKMADSKNTIIQIIEFINYALLAAMHEAGSDFYMSKTDRLEHTSDTTFANSPGMVGFQSVTPGGTLNEFLCPFYKEEGEFYVGRMPNTVTLKPAFNKMDGSIPNDDYVRYPHNLPLLAFKLDNQQLRDTIDRAFPQPRAYGSLKAGVVSRNAVKLSERCAVNQDYVMHELHRNFANWLRSIRCNMQLFVELLNDTFITRAMFQERITEFKFSHATNLYLNAQLGRIDFTIFPHNAMYVRSFRVAERAPGFVTHTFSKVLNLICKGLEAFPFMSFEKATATLTTATANSTYPGLGPALSASSLLINMTSPKVLAMLAALNIMPKYTNFKAAPTQYDTTKNPAVFGLTFLGFMVKKYMFSNIWMWNRVAWIADVHQFLMAYFRTEYGPIFNQHGFGSYQLPGGGIEIVTEILGMDKLTCPITDFTLDRPALALGLARGMLVAEVINALSLNNWNGIPQQLPARNATYRIANRNIRVPGALYGCRTGRSSIVLPIANVLTGHLNGIIFRYFATCKRESAMVKTALSAYEVLLRSFEKAIESFSYYFHIIYNVVVTKAALIPDLFVDDVCANPADYNEVMCFYDASIDLNAAFQYSTPQLAGIPILIPGISDEILGHNLTGQAVNVLLCAYNPMAVMQGMNMVTITNLNFYNTFAFLYESTDVTYIISDYIDQLLLRQKYVECIQLIGDMSINRLILNQPVLTAIIQDTANLLSGTTAAVTSYLAKMVNNQNPNINSFEALQHDIFGSGLQDPRNYALNIANRTPIDDLGRTNPLAYADPVRPHVRTNFNLIIDRVFGTRLGLRQLSQGLTYCMVPFIGALNWTTKHRLPNNYVTISPSMKMTTNTKNNTTYYYVAAVSINNQPYQTINVSGPDELYKYITDNDPAYSLFPAYTVVLDNPAVVTDTMVKFLTEALNARHCTVCTQQTVSIPIYDDLGSGAADESGSISIQEVTDALTLSNLKMRPTKLITTVFETGSVISQNIVRKMLPYNESSPIVVFRNLHTTARGEQFIDPSFYPIVAEQDDSEPARVVTPLGSDLMGNTNPMSLTTIVNVYVAPPDATLRVVIETG